MSTWASAVYVCDLRRYVCVSVCLSLFAKIQLFSKSKIF